MTDRWMDSQILPVLLSLDHAWPGPSGPPRGFAAVPAAGLGVPEQSLPSSPRSYRPRLLSAASNPQQLRFNRERKKKKERSSTAASWGDIHGGRRCQTSWEEGLRAGISLGQPASQLRAAPCSPEAALGWGWNLPAKPWLQPGAPEPQFPFPEEPLPCLGPPVSHGHLCSRPSPAGKGLCQTYMKRRIKPCSSITPDLWLHQPGKVEEFFPFSFPTEHLPGAAVPNWSSLPGCRLQP